MHKAGVDALRYETDSSLVILDSEIAYKPMSERKSVHNIVILTNTLMKQVEEHNKKGITLLCDLGTSILNNNIADLISYEQFLQSAIDVNVRPFCCYHKNDFELLLGVQ